ncbi:MAG: DUF3108 domain-containing protein [Flavobacteriales bacterium]|nr:DUF3108 domain-containing protein [Flavobacteriales bacterium]
MKQIIFVLALLLAIMASAFSQSYKPPKVKLELLPKLSLRTHVNSAFKVGEVVNYRLHYGLINAGVATLSVQDGKEKIKGRDVFHVVGEGRSIGSFDWFFKVRDKYESYIDKEGIFSHRFIRNCDEGGYKIFQDYTFDAERRGMTNHKKESYMTPDFVQDMISSYFYARTLDFSKAKAGDIFTIYSILDDEVYPLKMKYKGKETIKVDAGKFNCLKFVPVMSTGRVFKKEEDLMVWVTDDANHLPILAKAKIAVGSVKMEMVSYTGLANPINKIE